MDTQKIKDFFQSDMGLKVFLTGAITIAGVVVYYLFFAGAEQQMTTEEKTAGIDVGVQDTIFKKRENVYYSTGKEGKKKIMSDKDFFDLKETVNELNEIVDSTERIETNEVDYQKIADSILLANQQKVTYQQPVRENSRSSGSSNRKSSNRDQWSSKTDQQLESFFDAAPKKETQQAVASSDAFIYAVINNDQQIKNGSRVEIRLSKDALINGKVFKKNTLFYGQASFGTKRVNLTISNINQIPVNLEAHDGQDGNKGIYIENENLVGEGVKEAADDVAGNVNVKGLPIGNTIKNLFRKKNREVSVYLLNNYKLILKVEEQ